MIKGDFSHNYDPDRLRKLIKQGKSAKEILEELDISIWSLREHLLMLQHEDKIYYEVPGVFEYEELQRRHPTYKREGMVLSRKMLDKTGFKPGDEFEMIVEKDRIIFRKLP